MSGESKHIMINPKATHQTRSRYERIAPLYDTMEILAERSYAEWRTRLWSAVKGPKVLEIGVGTGKNFPYYPPDVSVTGIDLTPGMLRRAERRAVELDVDVDLRLGDVQTLEFPDNSFDEVVTTFVFCSVPNPVLGFKEVARVLKPGGKLLMLEHMRSEKPLLGTLMDLANPIVVRMMGANINRQTLDNVQAGNLEIEFLENMGAGDIFKFIKATPIS